MPVQDFKTKEPLSKKKFSFLFLLKSWENADSAFCIGADDLYVTYCKNLKNSDTPKFAVITQKFEQSGFTFV